MENEKVTIDGKEVSKEEFKKIQEQTSTNKKVKLKEVSSGVYKTLQLMQG